MYCRNYNEYSDCIIIMTILIVVIVIVMIITIVTATVIFIMMVTIIIMMTATLVLVETRRRIIIMILMNNINIIFVTNNHKLLVFGSVWPLKMMTTMSTLLLLRMKWLVGWLLLCWGRFRSLMLLLLWWRDVVYDNNGHKFTMITQVLVVVMECVFDSRYVDDDDNDHCNGT